MAAAAAVISGTAAAAWEPSRPIEIIVPFPPGGSSDQMARTIQAAIQKNNLVKQPIIILNKPAAAGGEAMMEIQKSAGDPHKLITTSSGIYMTPLATKLPVNWRDFTPVAMLAQDDFVLWVNAQKPYRTAKDFIEAAKSASPPLKTGGNGSKREDNLLSVYMEQQAGIKLTYIPYQGGGPASVQLAGGHIEANMNNPAEEVANWRAGSSRPLCVFANKRMSYTAKIAGDMSWADIPPCPEQGLNVTYQMLRGMFMPGKVTAEQQLFYVDLFKKIVETPEWKEYLERNALVPDFRSGPDFVKFLEEDEARHKDLMTKAGFIAN
ncbi:tripartite tricarboxylate transporter substrate binding protein [Enterovirga sp. DB1703]|uniref:Tripartite tricarboxylate transporter substrate binding protein n=2 Tax=Enterovirga aerilata TaxID=2730920 RepID=A0A849HXB7_9HYPH|nr:tripartite tricarboxylate transporter substrate binding protein [Enterovirga sp. DB1703]